MNRNSRPLLRAFTLIEVLVVIGIIAVLAGLLIPTIGKLRREAGRNRAKADLATIATALDAYKLDFGDIPRPDPASSDLGAAILCKALLGPGGDGLQPDGTTPDLSDPPDHRADAHPENEFSYMAGEFFRVPASNPPETYITLINVPDAIATYSGQYMYFTKFDSRDGADGAGFRKGTGGGKVWGPYLSADKFPSRGMFLLDHYDQPILYFPARPGARNLTVAPSYVDQGKGQFNPKDGFEQFRRHPAEDTASVNDLSDAKNKKVQNRIRIMLGDFDADGRINSVTMPDTSTRMETAVSVPYLLWSAGPDTIFGPAGFDIPDSAFTPAQIQDAINAVEKCDDVTNFRQ